jgi:HPt (histidine-containing phosphotransfer) domain-containing protein
MNNAKHTDGHEIVEWDEALRRVDGSRETLAELVDIFLEQWPQMMDEIEKGVARQDRELLRRAAHTLKGSASIFSAQPVARAAGRLSKMAQSDDLDDADQALRELQDEMERLVPVLQRGS